MPRTKRTQPRGSRGPQAYEAIKELIRAGDIGVEAPVSENEIARRLAVSRTPVREALLRLKSEGWLVDRDGKGLVLRTPSEAEVDEIYILREALEGAAARLAARRATNTQVMALQEVTRTFEQAVANKVEFKELDRINGRFHGLLYSSSQSLLLRRILEPLHASTASLRPSLFMYGSRPDEAAAEHGAIVKAIAERNELRAEEAARAHIRRAREIRSSLAAEFLASEH